MARFFCILSARCSPLYNGQSGRDFGRSKTMAPLWRFGHTQSVLWAHCGSAECWQTNFKLDLLPIDDEMLSLYSMRLSAGREERRNWRCGCAFLNETPPAETDVWTAVDARGDFGRPDRAFDERAICESKRTDGHCLKRMTSLWNCTEMDAI